MTAVLCQAIRIQSDIARRILIGASMLSFALCGAQSALATPVTWEVGAGGNGHSYELVAAPGIGWDAAQTAASSAGGHLATITTQSEQDFINANLIVGITSEYWLGASQAPGMPPAAGWEWVSGEPWNYVNWNSGEPNDASTDERHLGILAGGAWNDEHNLGLIGGYLAETPEPSTALLLGLGLAGLGWRSRGSTRQRAG